MFLNHRIDPLSTPYKLFFVTQSFLIDFAIFFLVPGEIESSTRQQDRTNNIKVGQPSLLTAVCYDTLNVTAEYYAFPNQ